MRALNLFGALAALSVAACGSPVPSGVFLTLSVSTRDVAVETHINGALEEFVSGDSGSLVSSAPINNRVREGGNEITFRLSPAAASDGEELDPALIATLEIAMKGEIVDTMSPGERQIFSRELTEAEGAMLKGGETIVLTETFILDPARLREMKAAAR